MKVKKTKERENIIQDGSRFIIKTFALSALVVVAVQLLRSGNTSESIDKLVFLGATLTGGFVALTSWWDKSKSNSVLISLSAICIVILGVFSIEKHSQINGIDINKILWFGFGPFVAILTLLLSPFIFQIYTAKKNAWSKVFVVIALILLALLVPAAWQGGASLMEPDSPEYVINELLSVPSGHIPYVNFIPQYGILYSWLISPFSSHLSVDGLVTLGLYVMSLGGILAVLIGVWLAYKAMGSRSLGLATILVIPFTSVAQFPGRTSFSGSIFSTPTQIPVRILPGMIVAWLLLTSISTRNSFLKNITRSCGYLFMGLALWLNTDFGMALLISVILFVLIQIDTIMEFGKISLTMILGFLIYPFLLLGFGKDFQWNDFGTFVRQFGGGFGAESIRSPGPVLVVLPLIISIFYASTIPLLKQKFKKILLPADQNRALVTASFFSSWSLIGFAYYLNRSYASGQMQILFLPLSVAMASYFYFVVIRNEEKLPWTGKTFFQPATWNKRTFKQSFSYLGLALIMSLPLATIIAFPDPTIEFDRLSNAPRDHQWPLVKNEVAFKDIETIITQPTIKSDVAYFGSSSNYVQLKYGIKSVTLFNSPFDLFMSQNMVDKGCRYIFLNNPGYVITNDTGAAVAQNFQNKMLCGNYAPSAEFPTRLFKKQ